MTCGSANRSFFSSWMPGARAGAQRRDDVRGARARHSSSVVWGQRRTSRYRGRSIVLDTGEMPAQGVHGTGSHRVDEHVRGALANHAVRTLGGASRRAVTRRFRSTPPPHGSLIFSANKGSARVRPRLTAAIGLPAAVAASAKRKPEYTISDEPTTSSASACATPSNASMTLRAAPARRRTRHPA